VLSAAAKNPDGIEKVKRITRSVFEIAERFICHLSVDAYLAAVTTAPHGGILGKFCDLLLKLLDGCFVSAASADRGFADLLAPFKPSLHTVHTSGYHFPQMRQLRQDFFGFVHGKLLLSNFFVYFGLS
jgi:hypothetical protein